MKFFFKIAALALSLFCSFEQVAQITSPSPYCAGLYTQGNCATGPSNSPNNGINDFINSFNTTGGTGNITNNNSGCNSTCTLNTCSNYVFNCSMFLAVNPGQTITCNIQSGIIFAQGFAIWIDWNQDNVFQNPGEQVAATSNVPAAATWTTLVFTIPANQPAGAYRMRVRCAFATNGTNITPCGTFNFGETEDYMVYVGGVPQNSGPVTATAAVSSSSIVCSGQNVSFSVATNYSSNITYTWTGPGSYSSTAQNPTLASVQATASGIYTVIADNMACPATETVAIKVVNYPSFSVTPATPTICNGSNFYAQSLFSGPVNITDYHYNWNPGQSAGVFSPLAPSTSITPQTLPSTQTSAVLIYSVTITPTALNCPVTKTITVTINNPASPTITIPPPLCNVSQPYQLTGLPGGGTWFAPGVSPAGIITPSLTSIGTNTVLYTVFMGSCAVSNTSSFSISQYRSPAFTSSLNMICEQDPQYDLLAIVQDTVTGRWSGPNVSQQRFFTPQNLPTGNYTFKYNIWSTPVNSVCPDSANITFFVFNPPTPTIHPIAEKCNNSNTVNLSASPPGGVWSGNVGITASGLQTPSLNPIGANTVTYSAGQGTCVASTSASFQVSKFNTAALTGTVPHLCASSNPFNLMSILQNTLGSWTGTNVNNNVFNVSGLATSHYTLSYYNNSSPNPTLCPHQSEIVVSVLNPPVPIISPVGPFCSADGTVQLQVQPSSGTWVGTTYLTTNGVFDPSAAPIGNSFAQYVIGTSTCNTQQTIFIGVEAFEPATLTSDKLPDLCDNSAAISVLPYSNNSAGTWSGPGLQGATFNPQLSGAGKFVLTHSTSSFPSGLCPDQATISVQVFSLAAPAVAEAGPFCTNAPPMQLTVSPVGGVFEGANTGAVSHGGLFHPARANTGLNIFTYSIASGPCIAFTQSTIEVVAFVSAALNQSELTFCRNSDRFNLNSIAINPGGSWSGPALNGSVFNPAVANIGENNIMRYYTQPPVNGQLCPDESTITIKIDDIPEVTVVASEQEGCAPLQVRLNIPNINGKAGKGQWNLSDGSSNHEGTELNHTFNSPGTFSVVFNYSLGACFTRTVLNGDIKVFESPQADFEFSKPELSIAEPEVQVINKSQGAANNKYVWTVQGQGERYEVNPELTFPAAGKYTVRLQTTTFNGCSSEISRVIEVKNDLYVFIPNSFSPNFDRVNDHFVPVFSPYGLDVKSFEMEIFDRWGHLVYSGKDPVKGWNGTPHNKGDKIVQEGVYVYQIRYKDLEGRNYNRSGTVLLLGNK